MRDRTWSGGIHNYGENFHLKKIYRSIFLKSLLELTPLSLLRESLQSQPPLWVSLMNTASYLIEEGDGEWWVRKINNNSCFKH